MTILKFLAWSAAILLVITVGTAVIQGIREVISDDRKEDKDDN
jgi:hypothetical protein